MKPENQDIEPLSPEEEQEMELSGLLQKPLFPILILLIAISKDFVDLISAGFLGILTSFIAGIIIWLWMLGKMNVVKKRLTRWFLKRFIIGMLIDALPIVGMLPITVILVLMAHNRETKIVKVFYAGLEKLSPLVGGG